jgi:bacterioferritin (cytochrome b1)
MIESIISATIAVVTGGFVLTSKLSSKLDNLDKRIDGVELSMAQNYVTKNDFEKTLERVEGHMIRIEEKLDELVIKQTR